MPYCSHCGGAVTTDTAMCPFCNAPLATVPTTAPLPSVVPPTPAPPAWLTSSVPKPSALTVIGFVLAVVCIVISPLKLFTLIGLVPTIVLSVLGLIKSPAARRGLAVASLILCGVALTLTAIFTLHSFIHPNLFLEWETSPYSDPYTDPFDNFFDGGYSYES